MFAPPWREKARKSRRSGHVGCQADFLQHSQSTPTLRSKHNDNHHHRQTNSLRVTLGDGHGDGAAPAGAIVVGGRIRFEFSSAPCGGLACSDSGGGGKYLYKIHTGGLRHRGNSSRSGEKIRKRMSSKRKSASLGRARSGGGGVAYCPVGGGVVPAVSAESECSFSAGSDSRIPHQVRSCLPVLGDSWRDTLLLQALRETGEEMKRRRQTYREVRARHAAEEEEEAAAAASFVCGDSLEIPTRSSSQRRRSSTSITTAATTPASRDASTSSTGSGISTGMGCSGPSCRQGSGRRLSTVASGGGGGGGGGMENISLTASVEVTVVNGIPGGGDGSSSRGRQGGDGGDSDEIFCSYEDSRGRLSSTVERKHQLPRGSTVNSIRGADVEDSGAGENEEGDAVHDVERLFEPQPTTQANVDERGLSNLDSDRCHGGGGGGRSFDNRDVGRRRSTILDLRRTLAATNAVTAEKTVEEEEEEGPDAAALAGMTASGGGRKQHPAPAPFRGTFWDEEDGDITFSARRVHVHNNVKAGLGGGEAGDNAQVTARGSNARPGNTMGGLDESPQESSTLQQLSAQTVSSVSEEAGGDSRGLVPGSKAWDGGSGASAPSEVGGEDHMSLFKQLSDGGLGRKALSAHTKNEDNRRQFFQLYRRMARQAEIVGDTAALSEEGHTPRQEFIREMLAMGRVPIPILLRDPSALQDLNLAHKGLGDDVMSAAAEVLNRLPHISTLNVADNRLTDRSLCKLCSLVVGMPGLKNLDLSSNKVDEAAAIIRVYLVHPSCSLQTLTLRSADVDDSECCLMMEALRLNRSLTRLDVSENKIGQNEMLNVVQPDLVTGGEGIAETLAGNTTLKELNLSWNNLRQESAAAIGRALQLNRGLVSLNLAHNAFNNLPSQEVGDSLRTNGTLQSLDLSYNGLTPEATIVIASACKANTSLTSLTLSGNRLGRQGSAALLGAIRRRAKPLLLGLEGCDSESQSPNLFDVEEPSGEYKLDMSLPFSRMVAAELVDLSGSKKGYEIEGIWFAKDLESLDKPERREHVKTDREALTHVSRLKRASPCTQAIAEIAKKANASSLDQANTSGVPQPIIAGDGTPLARVALNGYEQSRAKEQVMKLLEAVDLKPSRAAMGSALDEIDWSSIKADVDVFSAVFRAAFRREGCFIVFDRDRSGSLELDELTELFQGLGCGMDEQRCRALVSVYDLNSTGALETEEFVTWMMLEHVREPTRPKGRLMETLKAVPWAVPREGFYTISFRASRFPAEIIHVESAEGLAAMVQNIRHMNTATERLRMFENAAMHTDMLLTAKQAETMAALVDRDQDRVATAERLLAVVVNSEERSQFLESFLSETDRLRLVVRMKGLYRAVMGNPTGFYTLDLGSTQGRTAAIKLGEIANAQRSLAASRGVRDTSQKGNRMIFRNEVMDTVPQELTVDWFVKLPRRGIIRMDVVFTEGPRISVRPLSDARFGSLKAVLGVDDEMQQIREAYDLWEIQRVPHKPGLRIWQRGTAARSSKFANTASEKGLALQPVEVNASSSNSDNPANPTAASVVATTPLTRAESTSEYQRTDTGGGDGGGGGVCGSSGRDLMKAGSSLTVQPYHYDALSIFRVKECHLKEHVPDVKVPDCIIVSQAITHWQQYFASSHFFLEYVGAEKRSQAAANAGGAAGARSGAGGSVNDSSAGGDSGTITEGAGGGTGDAQIGGAQGSTAKLARGGGKGGGRGGGKGRGGGGGGGSGGTVPIPTKLYRWVFYRLMVLQTVATAAWYTCRQAMEIASAFPWQDCGRVQALVTVFSRIVDVDNFGEVVLNAVRDEEKRELEHRLGILNVQNPIRPDGPYVLDLKVWEEREWAKILIKLAVEEPGANWEHETYTHARGTPAIQGWLLPESWTREDEEMNGDGGPRRSGILCLRYITDVAKGCIAKWEVRRALQIRTLGGIPRIL
ncbi:unnamed protein product [Pylaiella littoralis]